MHSSLKMIAPAWMVGAIIITVIVIGDIIARKMGFGGSEWLLYLVWGLFMVAVYISTYLAPKHKLIVGMSHTLTISLLFAISNYIQSLMGMGVDLGGEQGFGIIVSLVYVTSFIPALIASVVGFLISGGKENKRG